MREPDDGNRRLLNVFWVYFFGVLDDHGILGFNLDVRKPGEHAENPFMRFGFYPANALLKEIDITPETIDDKTFNP